MKKGTAVLEKNRFVGVIDKLIVLFIIIFLLSLTNSIFLNQIGYFGCLLLLLIKFFIKRENPFQKSGLELAFIWFIAAELISGILSVDQWYSLNNLLKRVLLMPVVYVIMANVEDLKTGKAFFWIYIVGSLITSSIYIYFAYDAYSHGIYGLEGAGASFFQYPITAGEIISFSVVLLFAFFINEKINWKSRLLLLALTGVAALSLIATYKRTGWLGTIAGILIILLIKKKWKIIIPGAVLLIVLFLIQNNSSRILIYTYIENKIRQFSTIETEGRASGIFFTKSGFVLSDYENGLVSYENLTPAEKLQLPAPVIDYFPWTGNYYVASLVDTRHVILEKKEEGWEIKDEFVSPGYTIKSLVSSGKLYILDRDSGLTVYSNSLSPENFYRYPELREYHTFFADSRYALFYSQKKRITVYALSEGLPRDKIYDSTLTENITGIHYDNSGLFISTDRMLTLFSVDNHGLTAIDTTDTIKGVYLFRKNEKRIFAVTSQPGLSEFAVEKNRIKLISANPLDFFPQTINFSGGRIYFTHVERSKLSSIWDPYMPSNMVRMSLWRVGLKIFEEKPIFGAGDINMGKYQKKYRNYYDKEIHGHLHNNFIHVLAALGLFGLLAVCFMLVKMYFINFRIYRENEGREFISSYSLGVIGALTAFIVSGLTELNIWDHEIITLVYFTFGLNVAISRQNKKNDFKDK